MGLAGDSQYFSLPIKCQESQPKSRFSSKATPQLTSLACCRCVQKICAAKNVWGSTCELDFILQACKYIKNFIKTGNKTMFFHQPGALKQPWWTVILQPHPEQQFSCEGSLPLPLLWLLGDKWSCPWSGVDGLLAHTTPIPLAACLSQMGRSQFSEEFNEKWIQGEILIRAFGSMMRCLSYCALFKRYLLNKSE